MKNFFARLLKKNGYQLVRKKKGFHYAPIIYGYASHKIRDIRDDKFFQKLAKETISGGRTSLYYDRLYHLAHLDVNLYQPTLFGLKFFVAKMVAGGIIVVDDYEAITCPGVKQAVDEYLAQNKRAVKFGLMTGQCVLVFV